MNIRKNGFILKVMSEKSTSMEVQQTRATFTVKPHAGQVAPEAYAQAMAIARDPIQAEAFLKKAGLIIEAGKLAPEYAD